MAEKPYSLGRTYLQYIAHIRKYLPGLKSEGTNDILVERLNIAFFGKKIAVGL